MTAVALGDTVTIDGITGKVVGDSELMIAIERLAQDGATERFTFTKSTANIIPAQTVVLPLATEPLVETEDVGDVEPESLTEDTAPAALEGDEDAWVVAPPKKAAPKKAAP